MKRLKKNWIVYALSGLVSLLVVENVRASYGILPRELGIDTVCICHSEKVIDSLLKVVEEYPHLREAHKAATALIVAEAKLKQEQRERLLKYLGLERWDMEDIRKKIRRLKWERVKYTAVGLVVGTIVGSYLMYRNLKR